jgi:hypothetical protein
MSNELVFHIGMPKTGSTALQRFLYENGDVLKQYRWSYPNLKNELPNMQQCRFLKEKNGDLFHIYNYASANEKLFEYNWNILWKQVLKHLENENIIISSEDLFEYPADFWERVKKKYDQVRAIVYLRRQDRYIESVWNELIKDTNCLDKTFHEYVNDHTEMKRLKLDYKKQLDEISSVLGKDNLIVRIYENKQFCGEKHTLESDFLSSIGIELNLDDFVPCSTENLRLQGNYIEIKRLCNPLISMSECSETKLAMYVDFGRVSGRFEEAGQEVGYFSSFERKKVLEKFLQGNEETARTYLHREDGVLFCDNKMDYPLYETYQCTPFEQDLIRVFSGILCAQENKLNTLKRQNSVLIKKMLTCNAGKRKLLLFGAGNQCRQLIEDINLFPRIIADNDVTKSGEEINGIKIVHAKAIGNWSEYFVIVTCAVTDEIEQQLEHIGLKREEDYILAKDYYIFR